MTQSTTKQMYNKSFSIAVVQWRLSSIACIQKKILQVLVSCCFFLSFVLFREANATSILCFDFLKTLWYDAHHFIIVVSFKQIHCIETTKCDKYSDIALPLQWVRVTSIVRLTLFAIVL